MRIGLDLQTVVPQPTGVGQYAYYLGRYLPAVSPSDEFVGLIFGREAGATAELCATNFSLRHVRFLPARGVSLSWKTIDWPAADLFTGSVDLFHFPSFVARRLRSGTAVVTIHDLAFKRMPDCCEPKNVAFLEEHIPRTLERVGIVLVDSEFTARELEDIYHYPRERIRVIHLGVDEKFQPVGQSEVDRVRGLYGLPERFILCVATIEPRKNIGALLEAYNLAREGAVNLPKLVIVGGGGWRGELENVERLTKRLGLSEEVIRIDYLGHSDLPAVYTAAEFFVFPSLYEGFGLPPLEAMACATPVICSDAASLPEVVGDAAVLVPPRSVEMMAQAMGRLLNDSALRDELVRKGVERAKRFTWIETARKTLEAYRAALRLT